MHLGDSGTQDTTAETGGQRGVASLWPDPSLLLRIIVEQAPTGIALVEGPEHRYVFANLAYRAIAGAEVEVLGRPVRDVSPAVEAAGGIRVLDEVYAAGRTLSFKDSEGVLTPGDGGRVFDVDCVPIRGRSGAIEGILILVHEVTGTVLARRAAERQAVEAEEAQRMLDALMTYIPEGITIADAPDVKVRSISAYGVAMSQMPLAALTAISADRPSTLARVYHPDGVTPAEMEALPLTRAVRTGEVVSNEEWLLRRTDGSDLPILCNAGPIRDRSGGITGGIIAWRDISELKAAQAAARRSEERFRAAQDLSLDGFTILAAVRDGTGRIVDFEWQYANRAALALLRMSSADLVGQRLLECLPGNARNSGLFDLYVKVVETGEPHDIELFYDADGITGWFRNMTVRLDDGVAVSFTDITARRRAEEERRIALEQKELLLREMHHRVANSLQIISGLLSMQGQTCGNELVRQLLDEAVRRVGTLASLHRRLYRTQDIETVETVEIADYLRGLCDDLGRSMLAADRQQTITLDTIEAKVPTDLALPLGLIANELVTNALKHAHPEGGAGVVEVSFREGPKGGYVFSVADHGAGLPPDFDPHKSAGLGMRLVTALAQRVKGRIEIEAGGLRTAFLVHLPAP